MDKNCYSQVVNLMFDLYRRRVCREQKRLSKSLSWGDPVATGSHVEGCLRSKSGKKARILIETGEGNSRKDRILRRHENDWLNLKTKEDPYVLEISDNDDNDDGDEDFQSANHGCLTVAQTKAGTQDEYGACNFIMEGSSRRSARLCTLKLAQSRASESGESDQNQGDEWIPEQKKPKRKNCHLKRKGLKWGQRKGDKLEGSSDDVKKKQTQNFNDNLMKIGTETDEDVANEQSKETFNFESGICFERKKTPLKSVLDIAKSKLEVDDSLLTSKRKYIFDSESDDDANQQQLDPFSKSVDPYNSHKGIEVKGKLSEKIIVLSDSDQSNDTVKAEQNLVVSSDSLIISKQRKKTPCHVGSEKNVAGYGINETLKSKAKVSIISDKDQQSPQGKEDIGEKTVSACQSKRLKMNVFSRGSPHQDEQLEASFARKELFQDRGSDEPSSSQSSNSLLDKDGQIFSTQILRYRKNLEMSYEHTEKLKFKTGKTDMFHSNDSIDSTSTLCQLKAEKEQDRKRKALEIHDPYSKRQAHESDVFEKTRAVSDVSEGEISKLSTLRNKARCEKTNVSSSTKNKTRRDSPSLQLLASEDEQSNEAADVIAQPNKVAGSEVRRQEFIKGTIEDQQLQKQARNDASEGERQASLLEELTNEVDEKALVSTNNHNVLFNEKHIYY